MGTSDRDYWRKRSKNSKKNFDKRSLYYDPKEFRDSKAQNSARYTLLRNILIGLVILLFVMSMF